MDGSVCEVIPGLFLGSLKGLEHAKALGINYIVSVLDGRATADLSAFSVHYIDIEDLPGSNILEVLPGAIKFIHKALTGSPSGRVYVHCMAGVSRSATIVAAYLMRTKGLSVEQAIAQIRQFRRFVNPNAGFREQLQYWLNELNGALDYLEHSSVHHTAYITFLREKQSSKTETVRNVTIRQLLKDNMDSSSDVYTVDGIELQLMTLVGRIIQQTETSACINYTLHDGTGAMGGMIYVNDVKEDELNKTRSDLRVGNYVRVFGVLRSVQDQNLSFQSYKTRPVTDFNEITYHMLQVMFQRLHLKQGAPPQGGMVMPVVQAGAMPQAPQGAGMMAAPAITGGSLQDQLLALYHSPDVVSLQQGIHISDIMARLKQSGANYSLQQVKEAVEMLVNEAQLYSTVDDDTHKTC